MKTKIKKQFYGRQNIKIKTWGRPAKNYIDILEIDTGTKHDKFLGLIENQEQRKWNVCDWF